MDEQVGVRRCSCGEIVGDYYIVCPKCGAELEPKSPEEQQAAVRERLVQKRQHLEENPFDPRTEVSADAQHIVKHLWIIFVLLPFILGLLYAFLK
jgi:hypothetical protein